MLGTLERAGRTLELFSTTEPEWGATAVARELGIAKSQAHELLTSMAGIGLLQRVAGGQYRLGWRIVSLSAALVRSSDLKTEAGRVMRGLVERFGETVHLAVLERGKVVYIDKQEGTRSVRIALSAVGGRVPAHCSGVGKVLLAAQPRDEVEAIVTRHGLPIFTTRTVTAPDDLYCQLETVRERGYAFDEEEAVEEVCCAAAPIRDARDTVVAAMSMSAPAYRWARFRREYTLAITAAASDVSRSLRHLNYMRDHGYAPSVEWLAARAEGTARVAAGGGT